MAEKTILEWLKEIPDAEVREKALANHLAAGDCGDIITRDNLAEALHTAFIWEHTPEKHQYWARFYEAWSPGYQQDPTTPSSEELLKDALKGCVDALEWALESTNPARPELQSDLYNILTNALTTAKAAI